MLRKSIRFGVMLLALCVISISHAQSLKTTGIAKFTSLRTDYYLAALEVDPSLVSESDIINSPLAKKMVLNITEDWSPRRFSKIWSDAIFLNSTEVERDQYTDVINQFLALPKGFMLPGDTIEISSSSQNTEILFNQVSVLRDDSSGLFDILLRTWIGDKPPSRKFKQALLEGNQLEKLSAEFNELSFTQERADVVSNWYTVETPEVKETAVVAVAPAKPKTVASLKKEAPKPTLVEPKPKLKPLPVKPSPAPVANAVKPQKPKQPKDDAQQRILLAHLNAIESAVKRVAKYPSRSVQARELEGLVSQMNPEGTVVFTVQVNRKGQLLDIQETQISDVDLLNKMALRALRNAKLPSAPDELKAKLFSTQITLQFEDKRVL